MGRWPTSRTPRRTRWGGNTGGDYREFPLLDDVGTHVLTATPFSATSAGGVGGVPLTIRFEVRTTR
jgi:hypothetical protein